MRFIALCIVAILCGYSSVISASVNQNARDSEESRQQKVIAVADRLLKELAENQNNDLDQMRRLNKQDKANGKNHEAVVPSNHYKQDSSESDSDTESEDDVDFPTIAELYRVYGNTRGRASGAYSSSESSDDDDDDDDDSNRRRSSLRFREEEEQKDDKSPIFDDGIMQIENLHRRRRIFT